MLYEGLKGDSEAGRDLNPHHGGDITHKSLLTIEVKRKVRNSLVFDDPVSFQRGDSKALLESLEAWYTQFRKV